MAAMSDKNGAVNCPNLIAKSATNALFEGLSIFVDPDPSQSSNPTSQLLNFDASSFSNKFI
jgi:hypothetical protein